MRDIEKYNQIINQALKQIEEEENPSPEISRKTGNSMLVESYQKQPRSILFEDHELQYDDFTSSFFITTEEVNDIFSLMAYDEYAKEKFGLLDDTSFLDIMNAINDIVSGIRVKHVPENDIYYIDRGQYGLENNTIALYDSNFYFGKQNNFQVEKSVSGTKKLT